MERGRDNNNCLLEQYRAKFKTIQTLFLQRQFMNK